MAVRFPGVILGSIAKPANQILNTLAPTIAPHALVKKPVHLEPVFLRVNRRGT
jgi:hypothetical protein